LIIKTKLITSENNQQSIQLPKAVAFPENVHDVEVKVVGDTRVLTPIYRTWDSFFNSEPASDDFMENRMQPESQPRESFDD
jgi:antitoxin VapB